MMEQKKVLCKFCDKPTRFRGAFGTKLCNNCWEVESRLRNMPLSVIKSILGSLESLTFNFDKIQ